MNIFECSTYSVSPVGNDGLVLKHQGISSHRAEYTPMDFQVFRGLVQMIYNMG